MHTASCTVQGWARDYTRHLFHPPCYLIHSPFYFCPKLLPLLPFLIACQTNHPNSTTRLYSLEGLFDPSLLRRILGLNKMSFDILAVSYLALIIGGLGLTVLTLSLVLRASV